LCNTMKIENLIVIEPIPASFPCVFAKENNTVVTTICRNLDWISQLSFMRLV
jgi:hypothetical protein